MGKAPRFLLLAAVIAVVTSACGSVLAIVQFPAKRWSRHSGARSRPGLGIRILLVDHDVCAACLWRISVLDSGHLIADGSPEEVRSTPRVTDAYLGEGGIEAHETAPAGDAPVAGPR